MMIRLGSILFFVFCISQIWAQQPVKTNAQLEEIASRMVNDSIAEHRIAASDSLKAELVQSLLANGAINNSFEELRSIGVVDSKDGRFRIFSWQIYINPDQYKHCLLYTSPSPRDRG